MVCWLVSIEGCNFHPRVRSYMFDLQFFLNMDEIRHASGTQLCARFHLINSKDRINDAFSKFLDTKQTTKNIVTIHFAGGSIPKR